jgi:hypothetical protein
MCVLNSLAEVWRVHPTTLPSDEAGSAVQGHRQNSHPAYRRARGSFAYAPRPHHHPEKNSCSSRRLVPSLDQGSPKNMFSLQVCDEGGEPRGCLWGPCL